MPLIQGLQRPEGKLGAHASLQSAMAKIYVGEDGPRACFAVIMGSADSQLAFPSCFHAFHKPTLGLQLKKRPAPVASGLEL